MSNKLQWELMEGHTRISNTYLSYWCSNNNRFAISPSNVHKISALMKLLAPIDEFYVLFDNEWGLSETKRWIYAPTLEFAKALAQDIMDKDIKT